MKLSPDVINVLDRCEFDGAAVFLPGQLDRAHYVAVNKVIEAAGGKWSRQAHAHLFPDEGAAGVIERIILAGEVVSAKQALGYFPTPPAVAETLLGLAGITPGAKVLEPSAGDGALVAAIALAGGFVDAIEIDEKRCGALITQGLASAVMQADFLTVTPWPHDLVVMNPPFARQQDIGHVMHALNFLRPSGRLVSVMSAGVTFRQNFAAETFRKLVAGRGGSITELPADAFKASGTAVSTVIVVIPGGAA